MPPICGLVISVSSFNLDFSFLGQSSKVIIRTLSCNVEDGRCSFRLRWYWAESKPTINFLLFLEIKCLSWFSSSGRLVPRSRETHERLFRVAFLTYERGHWHFPQKIIYIYLCGSFKFPQSLNVLRFSSVISLLYSIHLQDREITDHV